MPTLTMADHLTNVSLSSVDSVKSEFHLSLRKMIKYFSNTYLSCIIIQPTITKVTIAYVALCLYQLTV